MIFNIVHPIYRYLYNYKIKIVILFFSIVATTIMGGLSMSMIVPLIDKVFVKKEKQFSMFEEKREKCFCKKTLLENHEMRLRNHMNRVFGQFSRKRILKFIAVLLGLIFFFKGFFMFFKCFLMEKVSHLLVKDVRNHLYRHISSLSMDYFYKTKTGNLVNVITNDTALLHEIVSSCSMLLFYGVQIIMYITIAIWLNWKLAILALIFIPFLIFPIIYISSKVRRISVESQEKVSKIISFLQERLFGMKEIKSFSMDKEEVFNFYKETQNSYKVIMKCMTQRSFLSPLMEFMVGVSMAVFLIMGGSDVLNGRLTPGEFTLFVLVTISILQPFKRIAVSYAELQHAFASADRIFAIFKQTSSICEQKNAVKMKQFEREIIYDNVTIAYGTMDQAILKNISFTVKKGEMIAIVGQTGCGKTSLLNLLPRLYDPKEGRILIDGRDIREYSLESLRSFLGFVSQDLFLFHDTIKANIIYGSKNDDEQKIKEVAQLARAHQFIEKLEHGYDTLIGERGCLLSGGQRQCLAIARALFRNSDILILDEATSALDYETEFLIQQAFDCILKNRTVIVVAHRLSTVHKADRIIVIADNTIHGQGSHSELLKSNEVYQKLYQMHFLEESQDE